MQLTVFNCNSTFLLGLMLSVTAASANTSISGAELYAQHCAACHGAAGRPDPNSPALAGLDPLPANLADPLFNSREAGTDWLRVIKYGGSAMGLSEQMPAFGDVLSVAEIEAVMHHTKSLADTRDYPPGEFNFPLPLRTKKAYPEDEVVWKSRYTDQDGDDSVRNIIEVEKRLGSRWQVNAELAQVSEGGHDFIDEAELGIKYALHWDRQQQYIISAGLLAAFPIKDDAASNELIPMLMAARRLSHDFVAQGSFRAKLPVDRAADGEAEFAAAIHYWSPSKWPRSVFPGLEVVATVPFEDNGMDSVQWTLLPQTRIGLTRGGHVALNVGAELPLSDQSWDWRGYLYLIWDFADGSFFKGWY